MPITPSLPQYRPGVQLSDGRVIALQNRRHAVRFDRVQYGTSVGAGTTNYVFQRLNGTDRNDTNILTANKLAMSGGFFQIQRIGAMIKPGAAIADVEALVLGVTFRLIKNEQEVVPRIPILLLPSAYGVFGAAGTGATATRVQNWSNGLPATGLAQTLAIPIDCFWEDDVYGELFVPDALTLGASTYVYIYAEGIEGVPIR